MNSLITTGNDFSARIVDQLTTAAWQGGLALLIVWCVCALWKNSSPRVRCWLWRIAFAKLLLALVWINPWQLPVLPAEPQETVAVRDELGYLSVAEPSLGRLDEHRTAGVSSESSSATSRSAAQAFEDLPATTINVGQGSGAFGAVSPTQPPLITARADSAEPPTAYTAMPSSLSLVGWPFALAAIWVAGVAVGLIVLARQHWVACRLRKRSQPASADELLQLQTAIKNRLALARSPEVRFSADVQGPMLIGFWKPIVLLPSRWQTDPKPEYLRMALTHEFAHVRRRDLLWNWLPAVGRIVFWFHPLVWMTSRHWSLDVEEACDELAVNDGRLPRLRYAEFLVWIVAPRHSGFAPMTLGAASPFSHLKRRLLTMKKRSDKPRRLWVAVAGCSLLGLGVLAPVQLTAQDAPPDPGQQSESQQSQGSGTTVQSAGGGQSGTVSQSSSKQGGTIVQSAGGGGGVVTQAQRSNQSGATVQSAGGGGGVVTQAQGSNQSGATVQAAGSGQSGREGGAGVVSATSRGNKGKTTVSIAEDGKSISIEVEKADDKVNVKVTRKEGDSTKVNQYTLGNLDELKSKDLEAYDVFKQHTQPAAGGFGASQSSGGAGGGATAGFGGSTSRFGRGQGGSGRAGMSGSGGGGFGRNTSGFGGRGGSGAASAGQGAFGGSGGFGAGAGGSGGTAASGRNGAAGASGGSSRFGRGSSESGQEASSRFGRGSGRGTSAGGTSAGEGQAGRASSGASSSSSGRGSNAKSGMQDLLQQLMELRAKNADNPEVVKAIDDLVKQLGSESKSSGR